MVIPGDDTEGFENPVEGFTYVPAYSEVDIFSCDLCGACVPHGRENVHLAFHTVIYLGLR